MDAVGELDDVDVVDNAWRCVGCENASVALDRPMRLSTEIPNYTP